VELHLLSPNTPSWRGAQLKAQGLDDDDDDDDDDNNNNNNRPTGTINKRPNKYLEISQQIIFKRTAVLGASQMIRLVLQSET
jgi:hypothetical protein